MPELPEVETVRRGLLTSLVGETIERVEILRRDSIAFPSPKEFAKLLPGHSFSNISRRGKYLLFELSNEAGLAVHLRMSGRLLLTDQDKGDGKFLRVRLVLNNRQELRFEDMRVFGRLWYVHPRSSFEEVIPTLKTLGVEPLEGLSAQTLRSLFKNRSQSIKSALLNQQIIAGLGNIYADESLFGARIHPLRPANTLTLAEIRGLATEIEKVLSKAIALGGSSLRDYTDSRGVNGNYQNDASVYGRHGQSCRVCGNSIKSLRIVGRRSTFCPICQEG